VSSAVKVVLVSVLILAPLEPCMAQSWLTRGSMPDITRLPDTPRGRLVPTTGLNHQAPSTSASAPGFPAS
jgi:hypothetical protein